MKIALFSIADIPLGKHNLKDARLDQLDKLAKAKKKTYAQLELVGEDLILEADAILAAGEANTELILKDLEFIESRLSRVSEEEEKIFLNKLKTVLEKEQFVFSLQLEPEEKRLASGYGLITNRPVVLASKEELANLDNLLARATKEAGSISFFTANEKEARAWLIRQQASAWEAAGLIHSDIQKGFIRAEVISFSDFIQAGSETAVKQAGKLRLEQKDYIIQDADIVNFRFSPRK